MIKAWMFRASDKAQAEAMVDIVMYNRGSPSNGLYVLRVGRVIATLSLSGRALRTRNRVRYAAYRMMDRAARIRDEVVAWGRGHPMIRTILGMKYVVAVYEVDRAYGGREEGGWWYDCGELVRVVRRFRSEDDARAYSRRMNDKLYDRMRYYGIPSSSSVAYAGGEYEARVYDNNAPKYFPDNRPFYE